MGTLGEKVLAFATANKGGRVEDGECWTLAERALEKASATTSSDIHGRALSRTVDYVWGTLITSGAAAPGDIIQFRRGFTFKRKVTKPDESWTEDPSLVIGDHHTAIVERVIDKGRRIRVIEQNLPVGRGVRSRDCYFSSYTFTDDKQNTVQITVSGMAKFYRPKPAAAKAKAKPKRARH
jgi:hypothetical protein